MFLIGVTQRSISSTATGIFAGSRTSRARCSGWRISASMPSLITWRVVSSPPTRISRLSCTSASSSSRCESISACTSTLIRSSSGGFARRSAITSSAYCPYSSPAFIARAASSGGAVALRGRQHLLGPAQQPVAVLGRHAEQVADHDHRQRRRDLAHEVAAPLLADGVDQLRHDAPDLRARDPRRGACVKPLLTSARRSLCCGSSMLIIDGSGGESGRELRREQKSSGDFETFITSSWSAIAPQPARLVPVDGRVLAHPAEVLERLAHVEEAVEQADRGIHGMIGHGSLRAAFRRHVSAQPPGSGSAGRGSASSPGQPARCSRSAPSESRSITAALLRSSPARTIASLCSVAAAAVTTAAIQA